MKVIIASLCCLSYISHFVQTSAIQPEFLRSENTTVLGQIPKGKLYVLDHRMVVWNNARLACSSSNLVLATIDDKAENEEIYYFLSGVEGTSDVWTAGNDIVDNGKYIWANDKCSRPITYFDWLNGTAPNDPICGCISIVRSPPGTPCDQPKCTGWKEAVCTELKKTLCMLA